MAALRHGIKNVIIPKANERDLEEIDQTVRGQLTFITAETVDTVLAAALNEVQSTEVLPVLPGMNVEQPQSSRKAEICQ